MKQVVTSLIKINDIYQKKIRPIELCIENSYTQAPLNIQIDKIVQYKLGTCLEYSLSLFEKWLELIGKKNNFSKLALNEVFFSFLFDFFKVSLENIYYPRGIDKETKKHINEIIVEELSNLNYYISKQKRKYIPLSDLEILYSFFSLLENIYERESSINIKVGSDSSIEEIMSGKPLIYGGVPESPPKFKDVCSPKKKDNLYQEKQKKIGILIDILNYKNDGIIIDKVEEILGMLYQTIYIEKEKIDSELISTKLNRIVNWYNQGLEDENIPEKDINFFNQYLKPIIHTAYGKKEEYNFIVSNAQFFLEILKNISSNPNYKGINREIVMIIHSFQVINKKIMELLEY
ncbi:MAG: hypothetical protein SPH94_03645 [Fusobacterium necrophorum]|nr:hypothetical protein [Fusobacterium necrophorum]